MKNVQTELVRKCKMENFIRAVMIGEYIRNVYPMRRVCVCHSLALTVA